MIWRCSRGAKRPRPVFRICCMSRTSLVSLVLLLSFLIIDARALQFSPASPIGQPAHPPVTAVAVSASAPQVVYAAAGGKLFRSSDAGVTWMTLAVPSSTIEQLAVDPTNSAIVYIVGQRRRSEEHTSELQSQSNLVCRLLLEKKKNK